MAYDLHITPALKILLFFISVEMNSELLISRAFYPPNNVMKHELLLLKLQIRK